MHDQDRPDDVQILKGAPRLGLANWPTPLESQPGGIWIKRDDLCGFGRGGAKARKIEHVLGHMVAESRDELITVAGNVTNLAFDLLLALDQARIRPNILIADDPPAPLGARQDIFAGILDRVSLLGRRRSAVACHAFAAYRASKKSGGSPFLLLPGGSHPAAVIGNACGFIEMVEQFKSLGVDPPKTVFITAATGNTLSGFLIGESALRARGCRPIRIVGVQVYPGPVRLWIWVMIQWTRQYAGLRGRVPLQRIEIDNSALLGGFGRFNEELAETCDRVAGEVGFAIDPIFGGKTWHTMERYRALGLAEDPTLFWHCGYTPEWRSLASKISDPPEAA